MGQIEVGEGKKITVINPRNGSSKTYRGAHLNDAASRFY
jgi:hypothetical protein